MKRTTKYVGLDVHQASTVASVREAPLVDRVVVCDRRGAPQQGNKGDQVDADALSPRPICGTLRPRLEQASKPAHRRL